MAKTFNLPEFGYSVVLGKYARQADGAVWIQQGGTVVMATVVSAPAKDFPGFLPLSVDYREKFSAAGKIPGGYFRREGKPSDKEVLTSRLIDRVLRPLFPEDYFEQVQVMVAVYSVDREHMPEDLGLIAASMALHNSKIPFLGPVGVTSVARIDNIWIYNPTYPQSLESDVRLIVAGTKDGLVMLEGALEQVAEKDVVDIMFTAHEKMQAIIAWQHKIREEVGVPKETPESVFDWNAWKKEIDAYLTDERVKAIFLDDKVSRRAAIKEIEGAFFEANAERIDAEDGIRTRLEYLFSKQINERMAALTLKGGKRIDGRAFDQVRAVTVDVGVLPFNHGSAVFTRGETQALVTTTLGSAQDMQRVDELMNSDSKKSFMLHYNFPPFATGEARFLRGVSRRETGHGLLALASLKPVLPTMEEFPYTLRVVSDILESNGSSSMATVCGTTMSLMDAGVPIKKMVSGIAMGLLQVNDNFQALTDINGKEDAFGLMDFKVAGTKEGITAIQMDIKHKGGLPRRVFEQALEQAKRGRLHILDKMREVMAAPRSQLSALVPKVVSFKISTDKIGAVIGGGGKIIRELIDRTGTSIDIEDDGTVKIYGGPEAKTEQAVAWVKALGGIITPGERFISTIKRVAQFGVFAEIAPGLDGLLHISNIPRDMQKNMDLEFPIDEKISVEVVQYDPATGRIGLKYLGKHQTEE